MKIFKYILVLTVIAGLTGGVYFVYKSTKPTPLQISVETPRPLGTPVVGVISSKTADYTSSAIPPYTTTSISGRLQNVDKEYLEIEGVIYVMVIGVLDENKTLVKIHLTRAEADSMGSRFVDGSFVRGMNVTVDLANDGVGIHGYY